MADMRARAAGVWIEPQGAAYLVYQEPVLEGEKPARFNTREQAEGAAQVIAAAESCSVYYAGARGRQMLASGAA